MFQVMVIVGCCFGLCQKKWTNHASLKASTRKTSSEKRNDGWTERLKLLLQVARPNVEKFKLQMLKVVEKLVEKNICLQI